jgi:sporulation protein YlmC with PRC-barrel domain
MREDEFEVAYRLLDAELIDCDGWRCGRVDDLEIEGEPGSPAHLAAILSGPGASAQRVPRGMRRITSRLLGEELVRVPWDAIEDIAETVRLKRGREDLGLGSGDKAAARVVARIPGSGR